MFKRTIVSFRLGKNCRISLGVLASALCLAGCSGPAVKTGPVFFPPPPNPPRIQFLKGIADSRDIEDVKSGFTLFVTGKEEADQVKVISKPYGITTHKGKIYVSDLGGGSIVIIDPAKKEVSYLKGNYGLGKLKKPSNVAFDAEDNLYVSDALRKDIVEFRPDGEFLRAIGKEYNMKPADIAIADNILYVLDIANNEIKTFDLRDGSMIGSFGKVPEQGQGEGLAVPTNFTMDSKGFLYVTNIGTGKIIKMDRDGHVLMSFGKLGDVVGEFARPKGITVDNDDRIYVVDGGHQNVQMFNEKGRILAFFGDPGLPAGSLNLPIGVAVTNENLDYFQKLAAPGFKLEQVILVTNQFGDAKLSVYGLGRMEGKSYPSDKELLESAEAKAKEKKAKEDAEKAKEDAEKKAKGNVKPEPVKETPAVPAK